MLSTYKELWSAQSLRMGDFAEFEAELRHLSWTFQ